MLIGGFQKTSLLDYPEKISAIVFTQGCNFRCPYCHNPNLITAVSSSSLLDETAILDFLYQRKGKLDAVVVSGGEPTLQKDLNGFFRRLKELGYLTKLDTNGTNPDVLEYLTEKNLVDYVAMDIKAPLNKYEMVTGVTRTLVNEQKSIEFLLTSKVDYEFRTTYSPDLNLQDIEEICKMIEGAKRYSIQKYRTVEYNKKNMPEKKKEEMECAGEIAKKYIKEVLVKGI